MLFPYPILRLTIPIAAGIFFTERFPGLVPVSVWWTLVLAGGLGLAFLTLFRRWPKQLWFGWGAMLVCFCLGALLMEHAERNVRTEWPAEPRAYEAVVDRFPQEKDKSLLIDSRVEDKRVLLYLPKDSASWKLAVGDRLLFYGSIRQPANQGNPGGFDYARYCLLQGISGTVWVPASRWKRVEGSCPLTLQQRAQVLQKRIVHRYSSWNLGEEERAVLAALTIGDKTGIDDALRHDYSVAGIAHVLALSGLHIGILWMLLDFLLRPLQRKIAWLKWLLSAGLLISFAFVTGLQPSVVRAVLMCLLLELGRLLHRPMLSLNTLSIAALLMLCVHPAYLFDVGFQLSFVAVASILMLYPLLRERCPMVPRWLSSLLDLLCISVVAQLGTAPLSLLYFSQFSVYFLLTNLVAALFVPFILYGCVLAWCVAWWPWLQSGVLVLERGLIQGLNASAHAVSDFPGAACVDYQPHSAEVWLFYAFLLALYLYLRSPHRRSLFKVWATGLCVLAVHLFCEIPERPAAEICFYHLPSCSAIHLIEPDGSSYLASNRPDTVEACLRSVKDSFWKKKKLLPPAVLTDSFRTNRIVWNHQLLSWRGKHIALFTDGSWIRKQTESPLALDYAVIGRGFKGDLLTLLQTFSIRQIILDASLYDSQAERLQAESEHLQIPCINLSAEGSWRIPL